MAIQNIKTVREHIAWSYANLACAHSTIESGSRKYGKLSYMIRAKLNKGLISGNMNIRTLLDDERVKYNYPRSCCYCGSVDGLHMDHLIPKSKGGWDSSDNLVWACKSCNSSKRDKDMLLWLEEKNMRPSILLLRRYIKLVTHFCEEYGLMDQQLSTVLQKLLPFDLEALPYKLEPLEEFVLWVVPATESSELDLTSNNQI